MRPLRLGHGDRSVARAFGSWELNGGPPCEITAITLRFATRIILVVVFKHGDASVYDLFPRTEVVEFNELAVVSFFRPFSSPN
jgi:hypothetical protein